MKTWYSVTSSYNDNGTVRANITSSIEAEAKPPSSCVHLSNRDVYVDWFENKEDAISWCKNTLTA